MNTLTIPSKIRNTAPKPTKSQLIDALVERARIQFDKDKEEQEKKLAVIIGQIQAAALKILGVKDNTEADISVWGDGQIRVSFEMGHASLVKLGKQHEKIDVLRHFNEWSVREKIKKAMVPENPLLNNDDVAKSLDHLLATIMGAPKLEAVDV